MPPDILYHLERALSELDRALDARSRPAADAHFRLSSLHLERMDQIRDAARPRLVLV